MSVEKVFDTLMIILGLTGFFAILYGPWQDLLVDIARQKIFEIRDSIFDIAFESSSFSFSSSEYKTVRDSLNRLIRFAHLAKWPLIILPSDSDKPSVARKAIENIKDEKIRRRVDSLYSEALSATLWLIILRSPLFVSVLMIGVPFLLIVKYLFGNSIDFWKNRIKEHVEKDAYQSA